MFTDVFAKLVNLFDISQGTMTLATLRRFSDFTPLHKQINVLEI
jgi:hypothetical protein